MAKQENQKAVLKKVLQRVRRHWAGLIVSLLLAVVLLCGCAFTLASCGGSDKELVVYTEAGFAPYEFVYENEIVGVDIKIMEAVAAKLGKTLVVKDVAFDSIVGAVKSGKADAGAAGSGLGQSVPDRGDDGLRSVRVCR